MIWMRFFQYAILFPTVFALLGNSRSISIPSKGRNIPMNNKKSSEENNSKSNSIKSIGQNIVNSKQARIGATIALSSLLVQNSALTVFIRMSKLDSSASNKYLSSTAVVMTETFKFLVSFLFFFKNDCQANAHQAKDIIQSELHENWRDLLAITIPAGLYVIQNNLQFVAVANLPAEVYQVLIQSKIITTALFSTIMLQKRHTKLQWWSIFFLAVGVAIVQLSFPAASAVTVAQAANLNYVVGFITILVSCFTSGFAGVYFERLMKRKPNRLWLRNMEMSLISIVIALFGSLTKDAAKIQQHGFYQGYNQLVWFVIFLQGFGGILVSLVVKYTNSMIKGFATSGSIILSCILSNLLFHDFPLSLKFFMGAMTVVCSTLGYSVTLSQLQSFQSNMVKNIVGILQRKRGNNKPIETNNNNSSNSNSNNSVNNNPTSINNEDDAADVTAAATTETNQQL